MGEIETLSDLVMKLYGRRGERTRRLLRRVITRLEGGEMVSPTLRRILSTYHDIEVGKYSHGSCYDFLAVDAHTTIGRYGSFARGMRIINHNHPIDFKSTSPMFFNPTFGQSSDWLVRFNPLEVGSDVWIGANAVIMPEVSRIGHGAIIGAGAVVNKDVPPYAIVLGNPARVIKFRFPPEKIEDLLAEAWWEKDFEELVPDMAAFQTPLAPR
ncbi:MAG: CatB-related O-acetyltransferase [Propionibacteriaceae bacterium]|nr:CatB-related O-acetyltransferase [Propionibacteriaceae bacterium]